MRIKTFAIALVTAVALAAGSAAASLTTFKTFVGEGVNVSTDGFGGTASAADSGTLTANVPAGATVLAAYLYTATFSSFDGNGDGTTLGGTVVTFGPNVPNATACCDLASRRADVTAIVKPVIDGGLGGAYDFRIVETSENQDGEALVVVYQAASGAVNTVGILDGFASVEGDSTAITFATALDPTAFGFLAEMRLGIGFSCCVDQHSTVRVNGTLITERAGNRDDGTEDSNGTLITMGDDDDPFSPLLPDYETDHERYDLTPNLSTGDTKITVTTANASADDNIFVAVFLVSGEARITQGPTVPEPGTLLLVGLGMLGLAMSRRRRS